jgi:hypothetical protein
MFDTVQNKARKANQHAMVTEKRMKSHGDSRGVPKQKWLEDTKKNGKLLDSNGIHM